MSKFIEVTHNGEKGVVNVDMIRIVMGYKAKLEVVDD